jgi:hypothetical protein
LRKPSTLHSLQVRPLGSSSNPLDFLRRYWTTFDVLWAVEAALVAASLYNKSGSSDSPVAPLQSFQPIPDPGPEVQAIRRELFKSIFLESSFSGNHDALESLAVTLLSWHDPIREGQDREAACCKQSSEVIWSINATILRREILRGALHQFETLLVSRKSNLAGELSQRFQGYLRNWEESCNNEAEPQKYPGSPPSGSLYVLNCPKSHVYSHSNLRALLRDKMVENQYVSGLTPLRQRFRRSTRCLMNVDPSPTRNKCELITALLDQG